MMSRRAHGTVLRTQPVRAARRLARRRTRASTAVSAAACAVRHGPNVLGDASGERSWGITSRPMSSSFELVVDAPDAEDDVLRAGIGELAEPVDDPGRRLSVPRPPSG